ncbi:hypothetical protein TKK_0012852 [Trichogramma kaykai]
MSMLSEQKMMELRNLVRQYPEIWDVKSPNYANRQLKKKIWLKIREKLNEDVELVQRTYQRMRQKFYREASLRGTNVLN